MDLTPQTLREVEFREKLRGYHPDDVDDFLEEVAVALDGLLGRLRSAEAAAGTEGRAAALPVERDSGSPPGEDVSGDTLRRTLLLAQRTADLAVAEAEESARKVLEQARLEAERLVNEAEAQVSALSKDARARAEASIADLEQRRAGLEREVASLQSWASQQRDRLRDVLSDQIRAIDVWLATSGTARPAGPAGGRGPGAGGRAVPFGVNGRNEAVVSEPAAAPDAPAGSPFDQEHEVQSPVPGDEPGGAEGRTIRRS